MPCRRYLLYSSLASIILSSWQILGRFFKLEDIARPENPTHCLYNSLQGNTRDRLILQHHSATNKWFQSHFLKLFPNTACFGLANNSVQMPITFFIFPFNGGKGPEVAARAASLPSSQAHNERTLLCDKCLLFPKSSVADKYNGPSSGFGNSNPTELRLVKISRIQFSSLLCFIGASIVRCMGVLKLK